MSEDLDLSWLDRVPETVEARLGPATRRILAALRRLREAEGA
jgi:hypothetical protein